MREIRATSITNLVEKLCMDACYVIGQDILSSLEENKQKEQSPLGRQVLDTIIENDHIAEQERVPMCQDTGMTVVFVEMGQEVHISGGYIEDAINQGVRQGYQKGYLRKSVVGDPLERINTGDNTPAIIHYEIKPGDRFKIIVSPKGFGSENKSALKMLTPSQGLEGIKQFVIDTVSHAGGSACPPMIVGVGIGGTMERCAYLSKKALLRRVGSPNADPRLDAIEKELLEEINKLGIGPVGLGGTTTAIAVHILTNPTHIAGLPVAVNISCHATRHGEGEL